MDQPSRSPAPLRPEVAIAHDYLTQRGGAERVVLAMARVFPGAPVHTALYEPGQTFPDFAGLDIRTTTLNKVALFRRHHRMALPFLPAAVSRSRIDADVVLASSSGFAHGVRTAGTKVVYCYTPPRFLYEPDAYLGGRPPGSGALLTLLAPAQRRWDRRAALSADKYLAVSSVVRDRIRSAYGIDATVVPPPPPDTLRRVAPARPGGLPAAWRPSDSFLSVSRLLPYKNVEAVVAAFARRPELRLVLVGSGPMRARLQRSLPANVVLLQDLTDGEMRWLYEGCRGLVAASNEDFGLTPLEAAAFGKPSVVLRAGGYLDTMTPDTAVFFDEASPGAIAAALDDLDSRVWDPRVLKARAAEFSEAAFGRRLLKAMEPYLRGSARVSQEDG